MVMQNAIVYVRMHNDQCIALIEYDGQQHYYPVQFFGCSEEDAMLRYLSTKKHDQIKNDYCEQHHLSLLRIPYFEKKNLEKLVTDFIDQLNIKGENNYG